RPAVPQGWQELGDLQLSRGDADAARRSFEEVVRLAPRSPEPWRRLVWLAELQHDPRAALKARKEQLARSPGDLKLRRQVEKDQGRGLLAWTDRDGVALALGHQTSKLTEGDDRPAALRLLDYGAAEFFDDGSAAERSHTVARLLDKKGIGRFGEAQLPNDAEILELRTIKPDGRVLEPDAIPNKDTVSLPGLEAGDSIEIDWLRAWPARGSDLRGVSMSGFYFLDDETPMLESTYEVRGPSTLPLEVDAHHLDAPPPKIDAEGFHWRYSARDVAPRAPEPNQPTDTEITPWVQVGWGAGQAQLAVQLADWSLLRARPSATVDALVLAAGGVSPMEKLTRLSASIAQAVRGRSNGLDFAQPAAHVLRSGRGNRLLVLQAALNTLGIKSRFALVRPFGADPAPMRFPRGDVFAAGVLTVELPTGTVWLDSTMRLGPVGGLPPTLRGQAAWIVPLPGEEPKLVTTPEAGPSEGEGRLVKFDLELSRSGDARGHGVDELRGFEAASLRDALERLDPVQRKQGVEAMLGRSLRGVVLEDLTTQGESTQGGPASLLYTLSLPLGRPDASGVKVPASLLPAQLGRRYLQKTERALPLLIENAERSVATVRLKLPQGLYASELPQPVVLKTAGAEFRWGARMDAGTLVLDEALVIDKSRIAPKDYPAFAEFARAVDAAQEQEIALIPVGKMAAR
ncbi:MAG: hypothetical protein JST92_22730, partial [Deltaproteobacteria bacterium]|nr:hypothetical protein [Deltaproteobacteria bacterium]